MEDKIHDTSTPGVTGSRLGLKVFVSIIADKESVEKSLSSILTLAGIVGYSDGRSLGRVRHRGQPS